MGMPIAVPVATVLAMSPASVMGAVRAAPPVAIVAPMALPVVIKGGAVMVVIFMLSPLVCLIALRPAFFRPSAVPGLLRPGAVASVSLIVLAPLAVLAVLRVFPGASAAIYIRFITASASGLFIVLTAATVLPIAGLVVLSFTIARGADALGS